MQGKMKAQVFYQPEDMRFAFRSPFTWNSTLQALSEIMDTDRLVTHRLGLEELLKGMNTIKEREEEVMKVLVKMTGGQVL